MPVVDQTRRRSALEKRLGVAIPSQTTLPEPSRHVLALSWLVTQAKRWFLGRNLYPHLACLESDVTRLKASGVPSARQSAWLTRLATSHDRFCLHKMCGALCLLNILRHGVLYVISSHMQPLDVWLLFHFVVAVSSGFFYASPQGFKVGVGYITQEVRWHAVLFSMRNISIIVLGSICTPLSCAIICLPFHLAVDAATQRYASGIMLHQWRCTHLRVHAAPPKLQV